MPKATDRNHKDVMDLARQLGCRVHSTHMVGDGFPDLVMLISGVVVLVEVKDGEKSPSKRRLTDMEQEFHDRWGVVQIVESADDLINLVNHIRRNGSLPDK